MIRRFAAIIGLTALGLMPVACSGRTNTDAPMIRADPVVNTDRATAPVEGLSRANWPLVEVSIVHAPVEHQSTYVSWWELAEPNPRRNGSYPTPDTVLNDPRDDGGQAIEAALAYPYAGWLLVSAPFRAVFQQRPWDTVTTNPTYARTTGLRSE